VASILRIFREDMSGVAGVKSASLVMLGYAISQAKPKPRQLLFCFHQRNSWPAQVKDEPQSQAQVVVTYKDHQRCLHSSFLSFPSLFLIPSFFIHSPRLGRATINCHLDNGFLNSKVFPSSPRHCPPRKHLLGPGDPLSLFFEALDS
jgi:hypothetical protein